MVTGRVCKNPLGLFSKGAQETLEVKLRLVPVPTVVQNEYLDNMHKYREFGNAVPHDYDSQAWSNFMRQNPGLSESSRSQQPASPMNQFGIDRFHQILSEGSTPREFSTFPGNESVRSVSPTHSFTAPSRMSTPGGSRVPNQQQSQSKQGIPHNDLVRPSSSASMRDIEFQTQTSYNARRGSIHSGYGSGGEECIDPQPRKRAKVYQAGWPGKSDMNIERHPSSLRVAASTAASVRIHRPTPVNPSIAAEQSHDEPIRPPTPISRPGGLPRRGRLPTSLLRESSTNSSTGYTSPYYISDDNIATDPTGHSPEESRYQGLFEPSFSMPSSPPIMETRFPTRSSPVLPPISLDTDSGFMSGGLEDFLSEDAATPLEDARRACSHDITQDKPPVRPAVQASSPASAIGTVSVNPSDSCLVGDGPQEQTPKETAPPLSRPNTSAGSRPESRSGVRIAPKPPVLAPVSQIQVQNSVNANPSRKKDITNPASDPVGPIRPPLKHSQSASGPMSDFIVLTPGRRGAGAKRVQTRLDEAIANGKVPPYCENCGTIETPTWRRAWSKEIVGGEQLAAEMMQNPVMLFWQIMERNTNGEVCKFKIYKKSMERDADCVQILLCNPCGLWLHKFRSMRPESRWIKSSENKKKRPSGSRKGGPLSNPCPATRTRSKAAPTKPQASSPAPTEASSVPAEDIDHENDQDDDTEAPPSKRRRANSTEPPRSTEIAENRWEEQDAVEALRRAVQSSPARNVESRTAPTTGGDTDSLTPKPVRRLLFPGVQNEEPLKELSTSSVNSCSPRRSPRIASQDKRGQEKENQAPTPQDDLDGLFESPSVDFELPVSPTPRRRHLRANILNDKRVPLPCNSPTINKRKEIGSATTPTRLSAERLQRIQESKGSPRPSPRQHRSPNKHGMSALPDGGLHSEAFESLDGMILDIFDDASGQPNSFFQLENNKFAGDNWADWLPSNYVSPAGSDDDHEHPSEDLINAILSDPDIHKENLQNSEIFNFGDSAVPDSGFFSSDALHADPAGLASKPQASSNEQPTGPPVTSPTA
ncbi:hypothetical protein NUU61_004081 [Penicillium alfredii]|uniref:GATA-type domain-containing protein n=1 Tax=Penicillium alfredii TaxID=1506179 RepID=A0A9W9FKG2_9EURO|nr:uncharacterized protein NUU61_004081 [Penicillium alfredii]KAJ5101859.1 hypothetical protein NUU61_004081 [Penicillium alfredii]